MATSVVGGAQVAHGPDRVEGGVPRPGLFSAVDAVVQRLCQPVDIASLVVFRVAFGAIMLWEVWRYFTNGWIWMEYIQPSFHFKYFLFEWVQPWPGGWMYLHFWILGVLAICILTGALYRISATLFFLGVSYTFLLDQATYLNHVYLVCVISFLMIFIPCHRVLSVDAWNTSGLRSNVAPTWALWLLRFQIAVPYTYGGIAKLNADWLQGEPVRMWLAYRAQTSSVAWILTSEWMTYLISYGGLLFDLLIVPLLLWRRTRPLAYLAAAAFHLTNWYLFNIGIFPWMMIAATLLFFPPSWPRDLARSVRRLLPARVAVGAGMPGDAPAATLNQEVVRRSPGRVEKLVIGFLALHVLVQMLLPFRHLLYPGDVAWTEEGHRFAWRMKLRDKSHTVSFTAFVPSTGAMWTLNPRDYVAQWQEDELDGRPDMMLQLAHLMADRLRQQGYRDPEVYVRSLTGLNGRRRRDLVDPTVNLAAKERSIWPADWLLPLDEPLRRPTPTPATRP
jgi:vitamin K-dependent gamma-carboxylase